MHIAQNATKKLLKKKKSIAFLKKVKTTFNLYRLIITLLTTAVSLKLLARSFKTNFMFIVSGCFWLPGIGIAVKPAVSSKEYRSTTSISPLSLFGNSGTV